MASRFYSPEWDLVGQWSGRYNRVFVRKDSIQSVLELDDYYKELRKLTGPYMVLRTASSKEIVAAGPYEFMISALEGSADIA